MSFSMQHSPSEPSRPPSHALPGGAPVDLPISSAIYEASITYGRDSKAVIESLYEAVKVLEAELIELRAQK